MKTGLLLLLLWRTGDCVLRKREEKRSTQPEETPLLLWRRTEYSTSERQYELQKRYFSKLQRFNDYINDNGQCQHNAGVPFPKNFMSMAKTILRRLFRVYAHIHHQHFDAVIQLQEEAHLNPSIKHFFFVQEFNLIDRIGSTAGADQKADDQGQIN